MHSSLQFVTTSGIAPAFLIHATTSASAVDVTCPRIRTPDVFGKPSSTICIKVRTHQQYLYYYSYYKTIFQHTQVKHQQNCVINMDQCATECRAGTTTDRFYETAKDSSFDHSFPNSPIPSLLPSMITVSEKTKSLCGHCREWLFERFLKLVSAGADMTCGSVPQLGSTEWKSLVVQWLKGGYIK